VLVLRLGRRTFGAGQLLVMAAGPSDLGEVDAAVAEGADLVDIGADPALVAAIRQAHPDLGISVTVTSAAAARQACAAGADLLRADSGGRDRGRDRNRGRGSGRSRGPGPDRGLAGAAADGGAGLICARPEVDGALAAGVDPARIVVELDPGPELTRRLTDLVTAGWPVLVPDPVLPGQAAGDPAGPLAATAIAAWLGARVVRTRDVRATRRVLTMVAAIRGDIPPASATRGLA
jgi:dihydropteroate synthase